MSTDVIDELVGIEPGSALDALRARRPEAREHAQRSFEALFTPSDDVSLDERHAIAAFVTGLHQDPVVAEFYTDRLPEEFREVIAKEIEAGKTTGPYGKYREKELKAEDVDGPRFDSRVPDERLAAALTHTHLLVFRPREAGPEALRKLQDAGWTTTGIVTISQLVAFLSFQVRVVAGLRLLEKGPSA
ncbi:CMD domain protein [Nonomuraea sp. NPDC050536]|uniref:CMD domain protein n=1 Tax=Nonomuraea sp. NPDC050536 TaxID=3364366 RepID=UPI0037CB23AC